MSELFIGLMSGTSMDAIDAVLMDFSKSDSYIVDYVSQPIEREFRDEIDHSIAKRTWPQEIKKLDRTFTQASAQTVQDILAKTSLRTDAIVAIGSHGQTIWHDPNGVPPCTIQIGNAQEIATMTGITTVGNFRQADINAGGQGAPLACAYHQKIFSDEKENRAVVNLGGIANITLLPADKTLPVTGFDTGPANTLLDAWVKRHRHVNFDQDGAWAASGNADAGLLDRMLKDGYFKRPPPKSTGRERFNLTWLQRMLDQHKKHLPERDVQATLAALTVQSVANAVRAWPTPVDRILLCGGGSCNRYLVAQLRAALQEVPTEHTSAYGISGKWVEAMAFAWLAKQALEGKPGNIPSVTGADKTVVLGEIFRPE